MKFNLILSFAFCYLQFISQQFASAAETDLTLIENSAGSDVVLAVIRKIYRSSIFEDDFFLGYRVALVVSGFGEMPMFPPPTHRGIWQLTRQQFDETQNNPGLAGLRERVEEFWADEIGPAWNLLTWDDLDIPLHAGIAFRLFAETLTEHSVNDPFLPSLLVDQAQFYQENVNPLVNSSQFVATVSEYESVHLTKCNSDADIVFVQDASCTVYPTNFTDAINFFSNAVGSFNFDQIRLGHVVYSSDVVVNFGLDNGFTTWNELTEALLNATRPAMQYTLTGAGLSAGLNLFDSSTPRNGTVPKILISYTDGSAVDLLDEVTNKTMAAGIETFAIGTAFGWTNSQLQAVAHNKAGRVLKHGHTYSLSSEFLYRFNQELCSVATSPPLGYEYEIIVASEERRYFHYKIAQPPTNTTMTFNVTISLMEGNFGGFYSWMEETPDRVVNDGEIVAQLGESTNNFLDYHPQDDDGDEIHLYIGIRGLLEPSGNPSRFSMLVDIL